MMSEPTEGDLKVWWIPQVPMKPFEVPVTSVDQGRWLCDVLADYDLFQYENRVKPDYASAGGVVRFVDGEWEDIEEEDDEELTR
jgi:hypothetical protein